MSTRNHSTPENKSAAKKAAVLGTEKKNKSPFLLSIVALLAFAGAAYFLLGKESAVSQAVAAPTPASANALEISFPVSDFSDGTARYFQADGGNGVTIRYYVVKASDGSLRTAFDACDACWEAGKGYEQKGDAMICRNCLRSFAILKIGEVHGGCNPAPLKNRVEGDKLVIATKDVLAGRHYFDLPKEK